VFVDVVVRFWAGLLDMFRKCFGRFGGKLLGDCSEVFARLFPVRRCGVVRSYEEIHSSTSPLPSLSVNM